MIKPRQINKIPTLCGLILIISLTLFKAIQIGFILANSNKIKQCTGTQVDIIPWLFLSAIFGLFINLHTSMLTMNTHFVVISILNHTYRGHNFNNFNTSKLFTFAGLVCYCSLTVAGYIICFSLCQNIEPFTIRYIAKISTVVDTLSCFMMLFSMYIQRRITQFVSTYSILGYQLENDYDLLN